MSFTPDWLSLRRAADDRSRDPGLTRRLAAHLGRRDGPVRVLDLGAGTGANLVWLAPRLQGDQVWRLVDHDRGLLDRVAGPSGVTIERRVADLSGDLDPLFDPAPDLVTASAFFDLCGAEVARAIVARTVAAGAAFLTVLTYDGLQSWTPAHRDDPDVRAAFDAHQRTDKGLGPALGPEATAFLERTFVGAGYRTATASTPWDLTAPRDAALIAELARGTASAVPDGARDWEANRIDASRVVIGHRDLLALPA